MTIFCARRGSAPGGGKAATHQPWDLGAQEGYSRGCSGCAVVPVVVGFAASERYGGGERSFCEIEGSGVGWSCRFGVGDHVLRLASTLRAVRSLRVLLVAAALGVRGGVGVGGGVVGGSPGRCFCCAGVDAIRDVPATGR